MRTTLIVLSIAEVAVLVLVLARSLSAIGASLRHTAKALEETSSGVKVIEGHCAPIGSVATKVNGQLRAIATGLDDLSALADRATGRASDPGG